MFVLEYMKINTDKKRYVLGSSMRAKQIYHDRPINSHINAEKSRQKKPPLFLYAAIDRSNLKSE